MGVASSFLSKKKFDSFVGEFMPGFSSYTACPPSEADYLRGKETWATIAAKFRWERAQCEYFPGDVASVGPFFFSFYQQLHTLNPHSRLLASPMTLKCKFLIDIVSLLVSDTDTHRLKQFVKMYRAEGVRIDEYGLLCQAFLLTIQDRATTLELETTTALFQADTQLDTFNADADTDTFPMSMISAKRKIYQPVRAPSDSSGWTKSDNSGWDHSVKSAETAEKGDSSRIHSALTRLRVEPRGTVVEQSVQQTNRNSNKNNSSKSNISKFYSIKQSPSLILLWSRLLSHLARNLLITHCVSCIRPGDPSGDLLSRSLQTHASHSSVRNLFPCLHFDCPAHGRVCAGEGCVHEVHIKVRGIAKVRNIMSSVVGGGKENGGKYSGSKEVSVSDLTSGSINGPNVGGGTPKSGSRSLNIPVVVEEGRELGQGDGVGISVNDGSRTDRGAGLVLFSQSFRVGAGEVGEGGEEMGEVGVREG
ncbi:hypothetical protein B484DRAFT_478910 [Ochromonadaceae sp. CCMP2298]|nr:hypothetical protein B484DRAFT_478910 [Ochromonadaceae sp. CCMP2298]